MGFFDDIVPFMRYYIARMLAPRQDGTENKK